MKLQSIINKGNYWFIGEDSMNIYGLTGIILSQK